MHGCTAAYTWLDLTFYKVPEKHGLVYLVGLYLYIYCTAGLYVRPCVRPRLLWLLRRPIGNFLITKKCSDNNLSIDLLISNSHDPAMYTLSMYSVRLISIICIVLQDFTYDNVYGRDYFDYYGGRSRRRSCQKRQLYVSFRKFVKIDIKACGVDPDKYPSKGGGVGIY